MGEEITGNGTKSIDQIIADGKAKKQRQQQRTNAKSNSPTDQNAEGTGTGTEPGTKGITVLDGAKEKVVLGLPAVDPEPAKPERKKRERKPAKKQSVQEGAAAVSVLLKTVSDIASIRVGKVWSLSEQECKAIADPLASIMDRYNLLDKMGEYGDFMALGLALSAAFVPRVFITLQINKERRVKHAGLTVSPNLQKPQPGTGTGEKPVTDSDAANHRQSDSASRPTADGTNALKQLLPSLVQ